MWDVVEKLGPWPILQFGVVILILIFASMTYMRVLASKFPTPQQASSGGQQGEVSILYFQGWFKGVFDELQALRSNQETNKLQMREQLADKLRESRHDVKGAIADVQAELKQDIAEVCALVEDNAKELSSLRGEMRKLLDRVEEMSPKRVR